MVPKKAPVRMSALFLPRPYHASPVFPSSSKAAVAVNNDTPSRDTRQPHPRLFHEHPKLYGLRRRPYPTRSQQRQQDKHGLPYPCLPPPNEQCEQHAANGKRVLPGTPEVRAAQCKSQRGRDKAQDQTHGGHGRLLSNGMPHLTRYRMICRDRRHVSRLSPQTGGPQDTLLAACLPHCPVSHSHRPNNHHAEQAAPSSGFRDREMSSRGPRASPGCAPLL